MTDPRALNPATRCTQCKGRGVVFVEYNYPMFGGRDPSGRYTFEPREYQCHRCLGTGVDPTNEEIKRRYGIED